MKKTMKMMVKYTAAGVLTAVSSTSLLVMVAYYQEMVAVVPALVSMAAFAGAVSVMNSDTNTESSGDEEVLSC